MQQDHGQAKEHLGLSVRVALALIALVRQGKTRAEAAAEVGVKPSSLEFWIATSRAGYYEYAGLAEALEQAERDHRLESAEVAYRKSYESAMDEMESQSDAPPKSSRTGRAIAPGRRSRRHR